MKILGVTFSSKTAAGELKDNRKNIVENIEGALSVWSKRDLSLIGKKLILCIEKIKSNSEHWTTQYSHQTLKHNVLLLSLEKNDIITKELLKRLKGKLCITLQKKAVLKSLTLRPHN